MSPLNRTTSLRAALTLVAVLPLAACGGPDLDRLRSGAIPEKTQQMPESDLPEEPGRDAPFGEKIEWRVLADTNRFARSFDPESTAECPEVDRTRNSTITCTVTYMDTPAEWDVAIKGGRFVSSYKLKPKGRQVVRDIVEDELRLEVDSETVRCDMDPVHVIDPDGDKQTTCEWGRADDSWKTDEREGVVSIGSYSYLNGVKGDVFTFADADEGSSDAK
ncbi:hypothetical protein CLV63_111108 [Murinocardiopsis flavida]|uniref:DUF4333 domain-containing protein n=1 Tax=Murinocardiopsis flavida TaxID=645275 RepID=A0A2P8DH30_9ACTN|nr:hypothetical protein [Murinocardiopsis flavida]PSK96513.1 hypothetical protein CLV63_111108 [Murinocardiopsis flavida]